MAPVAVPNLEELSLANGKPKQQVEPADGEEVDDDEEDELDGGDAAVVEGPSLQNEGLHMTKQVVDAKKKKKKKKRELSAPALNIELRGSTFSAKKKKAAPSAQSEPPRVGLSKIFKNGVYPVGQEVEYKDE